MTMKRRDLLKGIFGGAVAAAAGATGLTKAAKAAEAARERLEDKYPVGAKSNLPGLDLNKPAPPMKNWTAEYKPKELPTYEQMTGPGKISFELKDAPTLKMPEAFTNGDYDFHDPDLSTHPNFKNTKWAKKRHGHLVNDTTGERVVYNRANYERLMSS